MKYKRPAYLDPEIALEEQGMLFSNHTIKVPKIEYPIPIKENFKRVYKRDNPVWMPNGTTEFYNTMTPELVSAKIDADWTVKFREEFKDWFGIEWVFIPEAGGPMLKPGTQLLDDITQWEKYVKFPNLDDYDFEDYSKKILKEYKSDKIFHVDIGLGCTERLVAVMGGYSDAMVALALEPEAVKDFYEAFVDFTIEHVDKLRSLYPVDMITYHDDWGTERDTFFSEKMMEDIIFEPTKRLFDYIRSKDICVELHSCGKIERFIPYMIEMGADIMQLQRRTNDFPMIKQKYGDKIGLNANLEGLEMGASPDKEAYIQAIRSTVDLYAPNGGCYLSVFNPDPELSWDAIMELYYYSREFYEKG